MKLTAAQLDKHLTSTLAPVYLISGEELILKQDIFNAIRQAAKSAGFTERQRLTAEAGFDWEQLYSALYAKSLFAEKRVLEFDFTQLSPNKSASEVLKEYSNNPNNENVLLINLPKVDDKIAKSAWYKALEKIGVTIPLWPIPREQMPAWIMQRAKRYKMQMPHEAAALLTDYVEGNLSAAIQALEKIYLLQPKEAIDADLIAQVFADESRFTIFDFTEHLLMGDLARALRILTGLKTDGVEPVLILWSLTRELRLLADFSQQIQQGKSLEPLLQAQRIFFRRQTAFRRFLTRTSHQDCFGLLEKAAHLDRLIKGAPGNVWDALQLFCLRIGALA
jgi:DNA polymerase-3 subunit delta